MEGPAVRQPPGLICARESRQVDAHGNLGGPGLDQVSKDPGSLPLPPLSPRPWGTGTLFWFLSYSQR